MNRILTAVICFCAVTSTTFISQVVNDVTPLKIVSKTGWLESKCDFDGQVFSNFIQHNSIHHKSITIQYYSTIGEVHSFNRFIDIKIKSKTISKKNIESPETISRGDLFISSSGKFYEVIDVTDKTIVLNEPLDFTKYTSDNESSYFICLPVTAKDVTLKFIGE